MQKPNKKTIEQENEKEIRKMTDFFPYFVEAERKCEK